jgi:hypothetical protein
MKTYPAFKAAAFHVDATSDDLYGAYSVAPEPAWPGESINKP